MPSRFLMYLNSPAAVSVALVKTVARVWAKRVSAWRRPVRWDPCAEDSARSRLAPIDERGLVGRADFVGHARPLHQTPGKGVQFRPLMFFLQTSKWALTFFACSVSAASAARPRRKPPGGQPQIHRRLYGDMIEDRIGEGQQVLDVSRTGLIDQFHGAEKALQVAFPLMKAKRLAVLPKYGGGASTGAPVADDRIESGSTRASPWLSVLSERSAKSRYG
jgi:hypothetical protein